MAKFLYQGHASLRFTTAEGRVIYVDPYAGEGYEKPADLVLITHEHYDHNGVDKIRRKPTTILIRAANCFAPEGYYDFDYYGVHITPVPAANSHHDIHECVGFLLEIEGKKIYVAGDTDYVPFMEELAKKDLDYAFLPIDGIYNMGPEEATRVANILKPKHLIPYHMKPGQLFDIHQDMRVTYPKSMLVRPGDEIEL